MPSGGPRGKARGKNYVLPLAIVLVVGQIAAFVAIKLSKDKPAPDSTAPAPEIAQTDHALGSGAPVADVTPSGPDQPIAKDPPPTDTTTPPPTEPTPTAPPPTDNAVNDVPDEPVSDVPDDSDSDAARKAKRDLAKQKAARDKVEKLAKEKEDRAEKAERDRKEADDRRKEADARRASDAEKARLAAEADKARLAAEKAKAEAEAEKARLETEKLKAEAAAKQVAAATAATTTGTGSSKVLVLVFGPGVSSASREAIRNVYLGKTSVWPNGTTAHPMNRPAGSAAGRKFFGGILKMSSGEFREHWSEIQLSGGGISPSTVSSAATMLAKVAATHGGMGYVLESELPENTKGVTLVRLK